MWPFRRKPEPPELTNEAYFHWLRACRPPLDLFLTLSELEQAQLAAIGDDYLLHCASLGRAMAQDEVDEAQAAVDLGRRAVSEAVAGAQQAGPVSMAGLMKRRHEATQAREEAENQDGLKLFGKLPDKKETAG